MISRPVATRTLKWTLAALFATGVLVVAYLVLFQSKPGPERMERLNLALQLHPTSILGFLALDQGYFALHGIDVVVKTYPSGKIALEQALFKGDADVALANDVPVMLAGFSRSDFRIIGVDLWADNVNKIVARRDSKIRTIDDLRGKRIATQYGSAVHYFLHLLLLRHNLSERDVQLLFLDPDQLVDALAKNRIDAFSMREPFISRARARLGADAVVLDSPGLYEQVDVMVMSKSALDRNPKLASRFLAAMLDAESFLLNHPKQSAAIVARHLRIDPQLIERMLPSFRAQVSLSQSWFVLMESEARWAMEQGLVGNSPMPDYFNLIYGDALREIKPEAVTLIH